MGLYDKRLRNVTGFSKKERLFKNRKDFLRIYSYTKEPEKSQITDYFVKYKSFQYEFKERVIKYV